MVDFGEDRARFVAITVLGKQAGETGGRAQFPRFRTLLLGDRDRTFEAISGLITMGIVLFKQ